MFDSHTLKHTHTYSNHTFPHTTTEKVKVKWHPEWVKKDEKLPGRCH